MTESDGCFALSLIVCCRQRKAIEEFAGQCWQSLPGPERSFRFADMRYWNILEQVLRHFKRMIVQIWWNWLECHVHFFLSHSTAIKSKQMCFMKTHVPSKQQGQFFCQRKSGHSNGFFNLCTSKSLKKNLQDQADRIGYGLLQKHGFAPEPLGGWRCWVTELRQ